MLRGLVGVRAYASAARTGPAPARTARRGTRNGPPESVVNFRNMQRRRRGAFRTDIRVESKKPRTPSLREHLFRTSHEVAQLAHGTAPEKAFHEANAILHSRMDEWRQLARRIRAQDSTADHIHPQLAAAAWNQVIGLAARAGMPSAAWRTYCDMKRAHIRPTARTYAVYFAALANAVRTKKIDTVASASWIEHVPKLFEGLEQVHTQGARAQPTHDTEWLGAPAVDATGGTLRPSVAASRSRVVHETLKEPRAVVAAYSAYISLLCALGRPSEALAVWNDVCPDPYPGRRTEPTAPRLPRSLFATAETYTALMRDLGTCRMPLAAKQAAIRDIWARWQFDILSTSRAAPEEPPLLDAVAIKTLVWTLAIGSPPDAAKNISALLGTYCGVSFDHTPNAIRYSVPSTWRAIPFTTSTLLVDILAFYEQHGLYTQVVDCFEHAERTRHAPDAVQPDRVPDAVACVARARKHLAHNP